MKTRKINILNIFRAFLAAGVIISGCQLLDDIISDEYTYHRLNIDSIYVPDSISASQILEVNMWGKAGTDTCDSFSHYQVSYAAPELNITVWGKSHYVFRQVCPEAELPVEHFIYKISGLQTPIVNISIHRRDGSIINKTIVVY